MVLDPPAFVKSSQNLAMAVRGYRSLLKLALPLLQPSGILFMASCSHHLEKETFTNIVLQTIRDQGRECRILYEGGPGSDHPVHPPRPASAYLKAIVLQVS
eukprot:TRINITY_DN9272_c0_g1_i1.p1 TRINITY_DN9272_c0_g1~~TRINITY_DN9272_c0_g1_i1.p1  ORF type:complete len:101 (-),score=21.26 TRINITY_DN9272_c0_g1_i1:41-343(-)